MAAKDGFNPLQEFPEVRRWLYRVLWVAGALVGLWQAVSIAVPDLSTPTSTKVVAGALAAIAYLSVVSNFTADRNVTIPEKDPPA
jgi:uncharacterized membrane protein YeiB